jgi:hypothetical protein
MKYQLKNLIHTLPLLTRANPPHHGANKTNKHVSIRETPHPNPVSVRLSPTIDLNLVLHFTIWSSLVVNPAPKILPSPTECSKWSISSSSSSVRGAPATFSPQRLAHMVLLLFLLRAWCSSSSPLGCVCCAAIFFLSVWCSSSSSLRCAWCCCCSSSFPRMRVVLLLLLLLNAQGAAPLPPPCVAPLP